MMPILSQGYKLSYDTMGPKTRCLIMRGTWHESDNKIIIITVSDSEKMSENSGFCRMSTDLIDLLCSSLSSKEYAASKSFSGTLKQ
jgi:hypothetical protein